MTDKQLKLIYEYMGWDISGDNIHRILTANSAWLCVQEMERKGDWRKFKELAWLCSEGDMTLWIFNPDNFFKCFGEFLDSREGK